MIGGKITTPPGHRFHRNDTIATWTFTCHRKGEFTIWSVGGKKFTHDETTFYLIEPHVPYEVFSKGSIHGQLWLQFTPTPAMLPLLNWPEEEKGRRYLQITNKALWQKMYSAMEDTIEHLLSLDAMQEPLAVHALERVFLLAQLYLKIPAQGATQDSRILHVIQAIRETPFRQWSISELARIAGMSETNLAHRFAADIGVSPIRYADIQRMEYAKGLLLRTNESINAISERLGYANPYHFSNRFQQITGQRPLAFRKAPTANSSQ